VIDADEEGLEVRLGEGRGGKCEEEGEAECGADHLRGFLREKAIGNGGGLQGGCLAFRCEL
jgi:hypothetical protein